MSGFSHQVLCGDGSTKRISREACGKNLRFCNGTKRVDVRILAAANMDYFVADRMVWESLKIGAYAELEEGMG